MEEKDKEKWDLSREEIEERIGVVFVPVFTVFRIHFCDCLSHSWLWSVALLFPVKCDLPSLDRFPLCVERIAVFVLCFADEEGLLKRYF